MRLKHVFTAILFLILIRIGYAQETSEPQSKIIDFYFTNSEGERLDESISSSEDYVYMVLETTDEALGEKVTLTVDEDDGDFIYKNKYLTTHSKIRFKIKKNIQKLKLFIYKPEIKKHLKLKNRAEKQKSRNKKETS